MENLKYPIGHYQAKKSATPRDVAKWIDEIEELPDLLKSEIDGLSDSQLDTPYRENAWTIRELIHHLADSHAVGFFRVKRSLADNCPTLNPFDQDAWTDTEDYQADINHSLQILKGIHSRWAKLLKSLDSDALEREYIHPDSGRGVVKSLIGKYAWHGKHHLEHIRNCKKQNNWN